MSMVDWIFIAVASAMLFLSMKNWRGMLWIACLAISYFASGAYWRLSGDGAMFALLCDAAMFLALYAIGRKIWEIWLMGLVLCMAGANIIGPALNTEAYQISLEAMNAIALFIIGGVGSWKMAGHDDGLAFHNVRHIPGFGFALRRQGSKG